MDGGKTSDPYVKVRCTHLCPGKRCSLMMVSFTITVQLPVAHETRTPWGRVCMPIGFLAVLLAFGALDVPPWRRARCWGCENGRSDVLAGVKWL